MASKEASNLLTYIKSVEICSRPYVLAPYSVHKGTFQPAKLNITLSLRFLLLLGLGLFLAVFSYLNHQRLSSINLTVNILEIVLNLVRMPVAFVIVLLAHLKRNGRIRFLNNCINLDRTFGRSVDYRSLRRNVHIMVACWVVRSGIDVCFLFSSFAGLAGDNNSETIFLHVSTQQIASVVKMEWITYQMLLKQHIRLMNTYLSSSCDYSHLSCKQDIFQHSYKLYNELIRQADNMNDAFGWQMLFIIPLDLIILIYDSYYLTKFGLERRSLFLGTIFDIITTYTTLYFLAILSSATANEGKRFSWILRNVHMKVGGEPSTDEAINLLSMQAFHHQIAFSAAGVFTLDMSLITMTWSTVTTYLVILMQTSN